ncbi:MAG: PadR family transcriptional regulator [Anaerolineales bacterium]|nr:MAG: PadR family transcriptional regulator [Anaerolineales bacterium]
MDNWITQLRKGLLEYLTLNILNQHETYGYEIIQMLNTFVGMQVTESTVYPILARLNKEGFARIRKASSPDGPPRRYYSLTPKGKVRVVQMNQYWDQLNLTIQQIRSQS